MAIKNQLTQAKKNPMEIVFKAGEEDVKLSPSIVKNYLVSGDAERVTTQEVVMFMNLCKFQHLNPFLREAYLIKYGNQPATMVTGKAAFEKRAARCSAYAGFEAGVVVYDGEHLDYRPGALVLPGEQLVGGWADVFVKGYERPVRAVVSLEEYIGRKKDGTVNGQWASKPATMIRKVAKIQALREAFPEDFQGMYSAEEMNVSDLPEMPVDVSPAAPAPEPQGAPLPEAPIDADFADILEG
jgi:phage recombination protein Bet